MSEEIRVAVPLTAIKRNGIWYAPDGGERLIPLDFDSWVELVDIAAVADTPWDELPTAEPPEPLAAIVGMTPAIRAKLRDHGIMTVQDLADCATDDLVSLYGPGYLDGLDVELEDAQRLILRARLALGLIDAMPG